ncbi:MAG TPA: hypothetical protein VMT16_01485 [Thermoanaerobaculia bacterium]|nr:hypothetical protein [Thermoanaerobaculia bacterium]
MLERIAVREPLTLDDYDALAHLHAAVQDLRSEAALLAPELTGRRVWMVNSPPATAVGNLVVPHRTDRYDGLACRRT